MENKKIIFIIGIYIAIAVSISGYLKIDPPKVPVKYTPYDCYGCAERVKMVASFKYYRYSILFSIVGLIILYSVLQLFRKEKKK